MASLDTRICDTPGCNSVAKLQCPSCIKLGIQGSFFCSQECFKGTWKTHKLLHKIAKGDGDSSNQDGIYEPWPHYRFTGKLRPHLQTPRRTVPNTIPRPDYADHPTGVPVGELAVKGSAHIKVLTPEEIEDMKVACKLGREVLDEAAKVIDVGVTTDEIDRIVHEACIERECYPSPLNYYEFPKSCCTSVNEVICHGIPDLRPLADGDICNVDVTVYHRGFHGDLNETFLVGKVSEVGKKLTRITWECLQKAIEAAIIPEFKRQDERRATMESQKFSNPQFISRLFVKPGEKYREIGNIIQKHAQANGFSVVKSYCGHGLHRLFHTAPNIPHYAKNKAVGLMKPGHCFTIEPMISQGTWRDEMWPDSWTAVTTDGLLSAQFEQTLLVTDTGVDVLTKRLSHNGLPYFMDD